MFKTKHYLCPALAAGLLMMASGGAVASDAEDVIATAYAQWAAENQNKPSAEAWTTIADDYTEFNPVVPALVKGKAQAAKFYEASRSSGDVGLVSEMINPHVQVYGDVAILSYNYAGITKNAEGKQQPNLAKSTRIYHKRDGKWMLVHANFAAVVVPQN
ncbi:DUF4440 domain-containing protein [Pseudomarimonas arenosa]|uniref:DUF4440 domain-containing protein n=1 Tax=Pseudomarimonas arenosa TaxID=2774145 RepID=A0AAW3ZQ50_9GAMM|nr:DUF4440 domain-containing protein [Pseudomarimonas arenosa]MBD8526416.1 DUF4440 domain-containing protein [Pseudomarimonas arenosa]